MNLYISYSIKKESKYLLTLFHAGSDTTYSPPIISRKKKVFAQFLLHTPRAIKNRVTHQKAGLYLKKQKNILHFLALCTKMVLALPILELDL